MDGVQILTKITPDRARWTGAPGGYTGRAHRAGTPDGYAGWIRRMDTPWASVMHRCTMRGMIIRRVAFDHPDAVKLNDEVQAEYSVRYGDDGDATHMDPAHFVPPHGLYLIAYDEHGSPLATGGWRTQDANDEDYQDGDAEIKRMYVTPEARGLGLARRILAELESDARAAWPHPHGPRNRRQAARGRGPLHLQRLRALREVRLLPLPRTEPVLREAPLTTPCAPQPRARKSRCP